MKIPVSRLSIRDLYNENRTVIVDKLIEYSTSELVEIAIYFGVREKGEYTRENLLRFISNHVHKVGAKSSVNLQEELKIESLYNFDVSTIGSVLSRLNRSALEDWAGRHDIMLDTKLKDSSLVENIAMQVHSKGNYKPLEVVKENIVIPSNKPVIAKEDLISQLCDGKPLLTVTKEKMYGIFILSTDNTVKEVSFDNPLLSDGWGDHCICPKNFHELAKQLGCEYDNDTFAHICKEWVENHLGSDWTKLHKYLPR